MNDLRMFGDQTMARFRLFMPVLSAWVDIRYRCFINQSIVLFRCYTNLKIYYYAFFLEQLCPILCGSIKIMIKVYSLYKSFGEFLQKKNYLNSAFLYTTGNYEFVLLHLTISMIINFFSEVGGPQISSANRKSANVRTKFVR
jgi:hypothetical protein